MEQGMADLRLGDFEFFKILLPGMSKNKLRLPSKFEQVLGERRDVKMRLAGAASMPLWDVELVSGGDDGVYLGRGWRQFARTYELREGHLLVFRYDTGDVLNVTVFDPSTCRKHYPLHAAGGGAGAAGAGRSLPHINEPSHFAVTLRKCNLGAKQNQYLVGDTCFFRVIRERSGIKEEDAEDEQWEWEEEEEDDEHVLKVEVRKKDGAFVA